MGGSATEIAFDIAKLTTVGETSYWDINNEPYSLRIHKVSKHLVEFALIDEKSKEVAWCEASTDVDSSHINSLLKRWNKMYPMWKHEGDTGPEMQITIGAFEPTESPPGLVIPPGNRIIRMSEFLFSKKQFEALVLPIISDMREEYFEALSQNRIGKARWVRVRGTWSLFAAMGLDRVFSLVSLCVKVWKSVN